MSENYKKLKSTLEEGFDVHHIDWNPKNDALDNLIVIPRKIRELVHEYLGYVNREELNILVEKYNSKKNYRRQKTSYLNFKLSEFVDTEKSCKLSISCRKKLGKIKEPRIPKVNYRKLCENTYGKIPKGWEVHHIDWNHDNNDIKNIIALPKKIHILVHKYLGYVNREELTKILEIYKESNFPETASVGYLNQHLSEYVDHNKGCALSRSCKVSMEYAIVRYQNAFDWRDGKGGMF